MHRSALGQYFSTQVLIHLAPSPVTRFMLSRCSFVCINAFNYFAYSFPGYATEFCSLHLGNLIVFLCYACFFVVKKLLQKTNAFSSTAIIYNLFYPHLCAMSRNFSIFYRKSRKGHLWDTGSNFLFII